MRIKTKPILPKKKDFLNSTPRMKAIDEVFKDTAKRIKADFEKIVSTWKQSPEFYIVKQDSKYQIVTPDPVFHYVSRGTRVRYAVMTKDFIPKTQPGVAVGGMGAGKVQFISRKTPRPGIKARHYERMVADDWQRVVPRLVEEALKKV